MVFSRIRQCNAPGRGKPVVQSASLALALPVELSRFFVC